MDCEQCRDMIDGILDCADGENDQASPEYAAFNRHIEACAACRGEFEAALTIQNAAAGLLAEPPEALMAGVMFRLRRDTKNRRFVFGRFTALAATAALLIMAVYLGNLWRPGVKLDMAGNAEGQGVAPAGGGMADDTIRHENGDAGGVWGEIDTTADTAADEPEMAADTDGAPQDTPQSSAAARPDSGFAATVSTPAPAPDPEPVPGMNGAAPAGGAGGSDSYRRVLMIDGIGYTIDDLGRMTRDELEQLPIDRDVLTWFVRTELEESPGREENFAELMDFCGIE